MKLYFLDSQIPELKLLDSRHRRLLWKQALQEVSTVSPWVTRLPMVFGVVGSIIGVFGVAAIGSEFKLGDGKDFLHRLFAFFGPIGGAYAVGMTGFLVANQFVIRNVRPVFRKLLHETT
jgi:hypothetical protein